MSVLVGCGTRLAVHGMSGSAGAFHAKQMVEYGTKVVAGIKPGKGGSKVAGLDKTHRDNLSLRFPLWQCGASDFSIVLLCHGFYTPD